VLLLPHAQVAHTLSLVLMFVLDVTHLAQLALSVLTIVLAAIIHCIIYLTFAIPTVRLVTMRTLAVDSARFVMPNARLASCLLLIVQPALQMAHINLI
jgi:hypothetical protein